MGELEERIVAGLSNLLAGLEVENSEAVRELFLVGRQVSRGVGHDSVTREEVGKLQFHTGDVRSDLPHKLARFDRPDINLGRVFFVDRATQKHFSVGT